MALLENNMADFAFTIESEVNGSKPEVWKHVTQMKNVNVELGPFVKMTYPKDRCELSDPNIVPYNTVLFTSVLLLFGLIPFDLHYLKFDKIDEGTAFYENSYTLLNKYWKHTRIVSERSGKVLVLDDVHFCPRLPFVGYLLLPIVRFLFKNRHAKLRAAFGSK